METTSWEEVQPSGSVQPSGPETRGGGGGGGGDGEGGGREVAEDKEGGGRGRLGSFLE